MQQLEHFLRIWQIEVRAILLDICGIKGLIITIITSLDPRASVRRPPVLSNKHSSL